jgi:hypothetical protein
MRDRGNSYGEHEVLGRLGSAAILEKIRNHEVLSVAEMQEAQGTALDEVAKAFLDGVGHKKHEIALRNPAVLFDSMSKHEFDSLPPEVQQKVRLAAEVSLSIMRTQYGDEYDSHLSELSNKHRMEIGQPLHGAQMMVNTGEFDKVDQRYIGLIAKELKQAFDDAWKYGVDHSLREMTSEDRVAYYGGNAAAAYREVEK